MQQAASAPIHPFGTIPSNAEARGTDRRHCARQEYCIVNPPERSRAYALLVRLL
jgi:hypothetical protein